MDRLGSILALVIGLGCTPVVAAPARPELVPEVETEPSASLGVIAGTVKKSTTGEPIANALVHLQCPCLPALQERFTNVRGIYWFEGLPGGNYTIQVFTGVADVSKVTELPEGAKFKANFLVNPEFDVPVVIVVEAPLPREFDASVEILSHGRSSNCEWSVLPMPIQFRTTVGNSLRDAVEASSYWSTFR